MTYCVALRLDAGMLFVSDSRTNAGVDQIATFGKTKVFERKDERVMVILSSGNLAVSQAVINMLEQHQRAEHGHSTIWSVGSLFEVTCLVGEALREVHRRDGPYLAQGNVDSSANFIVGGQIKGEEQRLFSVYPQGNFIEASLDTIYFQLGESKYGKPILDRVISSATSPMDAAKCVLISFDSTIRSNISVGLPIDLLWYPRDSLRAGTPKRIEDGNPYFNMLRQGWGAGLRRVFAELPNPDWMV